MPHVQTIEKSETSEQLSAMFQMAEASMGFTPNSMKTMAHWPELVGAFGPLAALVINGGEVDRGLKQMIAAVVSKAAGCRYCQAHTTHVAAHSAGVEAEKVAKVWEHQTSDLFDDAERVALDLALAAGQVPNASNAEHFAALKQHFNEREIVEIVAVISMFGFLNRWNDTMATELEDKPKSFASETFAPDQWNAGKHA